MRIAGGGRGVVCVFSAMDMVAENEIDVLRQGAVVSFRRGAQLLQQVSVDGYADFLFQWLQRYILTAYVSLRLLYYYLSKSIDK